jgi:hypothetical protein
MTFLIVRDKGTYIEFPCDKETNKTLRNCFIYFVTVWFYFVLYSYSQGPEHENYQINFIKKALMIRK